MLPNDQMVDDAWATLHNALPSGVSTTLVRCALAEAFNAIDEDALVDQAADALASTGIEHALRERAQVVLRAVGLLP